MNKKNTFKAIKNCLSIINQRRGIVYPETGFLYFSDVAGMTAQYRPKVYQIINENGGVDLSDFNGATYAETLERLRDETRNGPGVMYQTNSEFFASIVRPEFTIQIFRNDLGRYAATLAGSREGRNHWCDCPEVAAEYLARENGFNLKRRLYRVETAYYTPKGRKVDLGAIQGHYSPDLARILGASRLIDLARMNKRRKVSHRADMVSVTYIGEQIRSQ